MHHDSRAQLPEGVPAEARGYEGFAGTIHPHMSQSRPAWDEPATAEDGAPNVILMVIDDMGFSDLGPFGSEIPTPAIDSLVDDGGVVLNNYHTASVCSPARAALLTGVNPHRAGFATVAGFNPGFPGFALELSDDVVTLPESLREAGYATFGIGKWHLTRDDATFEGASRRSWPIQRGFDQYYGCLEGFTHFFTPNRIVRDNTTVAVDRYPDDYYLTDDLTDQAIDMIRGLRTSEQKKPFFLYFAHNAMHGPLGAKREDIGAHRGKYAAGWDEVRRERFARQIAAGLFPEGTRMVERNLEPGDDVAPWDSVDAESRERFERYMEVYAAMVDNIDQNLARILGVLDEYGERDNTIIIVTSDNGGTAEGGPEGTRSYFSQFINGLRLPGDWERDRDVDLDLVGGPRASVHYPRGWAMTSNTPFRLYKGSTFGGGVRAPFVFSWPAKLRGVETDRLRGQFMYATDVMPTILDACGVVRPDSRQGVEVKDLDGVSALPQLLGSSDAEFRSTQYAEWNGHFGLFHDGFKLLSRRAGPIIDVDATEWQLYDVRADPAETTDLSGERPEKVAELASLWTSLAWHNTVFPVADNPGLVFHFQPESNERFTEPLTIRPGSPTVERHRSAQLTNLREFTITTTLAESSGEGVLVAHGDQGGGYVLYGEQGILRFEYNEYGIMRTIEVPFDRSGASEITLDFVFGSEEFHLDVSLLIDGTEVARLNGLMMLTGLAPFTGIDVGIDRRGPVSWEMHERHGAFPFTGAIEQVRYTPGTQAPYDAARIAAAALQAAHIYD